MAVGIEFKGESYGLLIDSDLNRGIAGALRRNGITDLSAGIIAMVGIAVPTFVIGPLLQILFGLAIPLVVSLSSAIAASIVARRLSFMGIPLVAPSNFLVRPLLAEG